MARLVKVKKRKLKVESIFVIFAFISLIILLADSLFLSTRMNNLTIEIQNIEYQINEIRDENKNITVDIASLENRERIYNYAQSAGMGQNDNNIVALSGE